jgi:hypothetical protein
LIDVILEVGGIAELVAAADVLAMRFSARCWVIADDELLTSDYPALQAVGQAAARARVSSTSAGVRRAPPK